MSINSNFYKELQIKPKAISFDWDGTLCDTRDAIVSSLNHVLKIYQLDEWNISKKKRDTNKSLKENFVNIFGNDYKEAYIEYLKYYEQECIDKVKIIDASDVFLKKLISLGIFVYIVSNKEKSVLVKEIKNCFPNISFKNILGNGDTKNNKPSPDPLIKIFSEFNIEINQENFWHVGDGNPDYNSAIKANVLPIMIGKGNFEYEIPLKFSGFSELSEEMTWL